MKLVGIFLVALFIIVRAIKFVDPTSSFSLKCQQFAPETYHVVVWTQLKNEDAPNDQEGYVRSVFYGDNKVKDLACPKIFFNNNKADVMTSRSNLAIRPKCFNVLVCEYKISSAEFNIFIQTSDLKRWSVPSLPKKVDKILLLGDTGSKETFENCQNGSCQMEYALWPIQEHAIQQKFDLMIHTGDFRYTDVECNKNDCEDHLQNWIVEFFGPLYKLLKKAPVVFVRGNHEMCDPKEAGIGWFHFLYNKRAKDTPHCDQSSTGDWRYPLPWKFTVSKQQFIIMDSSFANDYPSQDASKYDDIIKEVKKMALEISSASILLTHKPIWACKGETSDDKLLNWTLQKAFDNQLPKGIKLVVTGHIHAHALITHKSAPPQLVVGNGGVKLNTDWKIPNNGQITIAGQIFKVVPQAEFGYDILTLDVNNVLGWNVTSWFVKLQGVRPPLWRVENQKFTNPQ